MTMKKESKMVHKLAMTPIYALIQFVLHHVAVSLSLFLFLYYGLSFSFPLSLSLPLYIDPIRRKPCARMLPNPFQDNYNQPNE